MATLWADAVNRHGGDATMVHLPEIGLTGNMHFLFSDLNNLQIADQMSASSRDAILQPPKPEIVPSARILQLAAEHDAEPDHEAAD